METRQEKKGGLDQWSGVEKNEEGWELWLRLRRANAQLKLAPLVASSFRMAGRSSEWGLHPGTNEWTGDEKWRLVGPTRGQQPIRWGPQNGRIYYMKKSLLLHNFSWKRWAKVNRQMMGGPK